MGLDSFPPSLKHEVLEIGGSLELLKTCRFLSKSWNEICCRILRKVSTVPLNELRGDGKDLEDFKNIILDRHDQFPPDWPNPFKSYSILQASFSSRSFVRFMERPNVSITTLSIVHDMKLNLANFTRILDLHKGSIIHFKIQGNSDSTPFVTLSEGLGSGWRSLESVTLVDNCEGPETSCSHMDFIIGLTGSTSIKTLRLRGRLWNVTRIFGRNNNCWDQLRYLELRDVGPPRPATPAEVINSYMRWTEEIKFPSLTGLKIWFPYDLQPERTSAQLTPYILPLIQENSAGLEKLRVSFLSLSLLPSCPRLRDLGCALMDGDRVQDFTELRFPSLTSVHAVLWWKGVPLYTDPKDAPNHRKVQLFKVSWPAIFASTEARQEIWPSLSDHFPCLATLVVQPKIDFNCLSAISRRLPGLKGLTLGEVDYKDLLDPWYSPAETPNDWYSESCENSPLLDLAELTHLTLGGWSELSREVFIGCERRLPKLKFLSFKWSYGLETSDIPKYLGHIQSVTVICRHIQPKQALLEVAKTMKNLNLKRC